MKQEDVKLGMKVVANMGSVISKHTRVLGIPPAMVEATFLYVVQSLPHCKNVFGLSIKAEYEVNETYFFHVSDFEPFSGAACPVGGFDAGEFFYTNFTESNTIRAKGLDMLKEHLSSNRFVLPTNRYVTTKTKEEIQLQTLIAKVKIIKGKAARLKLEQNNLITFADINGLSINWETGGVEKKIKGLKKALKKYEKKAVCAIGFVKLLKL